jgi:hypothetical protein
MSKLRSTLQIKSTRKSDKPVDVEAAEAQIIASSKASIQKHYHESKKSGRTFGHDSTIEAAEGWITEHAVPLEELAKMLKSDFSADKAAQSNGLSTEEARQRFIEDGK